MEKRSVTTIRPGDPRKAIFGAGDEYYYFATGQETDGHYFFLEGVVPPGGGPPPHIQTREEEAFYILEGVVTFYAEGEEIMAPAGTYLNIPKGVKHRVRNNTATTARLLMFFAPSGIEGLFEDAASNTELANDPDQAMEALNAVGEPYGVQFFEK